MTRHSALIAVLWLSAASAVLGESVSRPHPAVVRIIAPDRDGASYGSGTLVAVGRQRGLVVTNWHVIRDAKGPVLVVFPDGFRSPATILRTDRDWDLAALAIHRPNVRPIPFATAAPRRGDVLTIAGYGSGWYRAAAGRCGQYVSPGVNFPYEMLELSTPARNGDSGGPILNRRGELAGVLFGSATGQTTGTYCGRVRRFLDPVWADFQELPSSATMIAARPSSPATTVEQRQSPDRIPTATITAISAAPVADLVPPLAPPSIAAGAPVPAAAIPPTVGLPTRADQIKMILAVIGAIAILFHGLRLFGIVLRA